VASGVLHDIGNAVVGFGSHLTRTRRLLDQSDLDKLGKLNAFIAGQRDKFAETLGSAKADALAQLVSGLDHNFKQTAMELEQSLKEQMGIVSHISDILNIQIHYISGEKKPREDLSLRNTVYDAIAILLASIEKRAIVLSSDLPEEVPLFKADKTKILQVVTNLIKNAVEAIEEQTEDQRKIHLSLGYNDEFIELQIQDSGVGFDAETAAGLFKRGFTTKKRRLGYWLSRSPKSGGKPRRQFGIS
jgi:signal transduction histidine kinase